jgi:hypothetical protein
MKKRKVVWEAYQEQESATASRTLGGRGHTGFASETAKTLGISTWEVQRSIARAEMLGDDADDLVGTS